MDASTLWWLAAALAVAAELLTGTFYLLMAALGLAAGALAAHAGLGGSAQLLAAALVGGGAVALWSLLLRRRRAAPSGADPAQSLDIGQSVQVSAWQADGSARVHYRGSLWSARWGEPGPLPAPGHYVIRALHGNELLLGR